MWLELKLQSVAKEGLLALELSCGLRTVVVVEVVLKHVEQAEDVFRCL